MADEARHRAEMARALQSIQHLFMSAPVSAPGSSSKPEKKPIKFTLFEELVQCEVMENAIQRVRAHCLDFSHAFRTLSGILSDL